MLINPIYKLIAEGEHQQQDFKFCINDSKKIAKSLVAFANTDGGRLLIGVKDNGNITGVKSDEEFYMIDAAAKIYSKPQIEFISQEWDVDGKIVLEIIIQPSKNKPHYAKGDNNKWIAFVRKDDENVLANNVILKAWKLERNKKGLLFKYDNDRKKLIDYLNSNQNITLSKFARIASIHRKTAEDILAEFVFLGCINVSLHEEPVHYSINEIFDFSELETPS